MAQVRQVMLGGVGGQGIVLAGNLLGQAAFMEGKWVSGTSSYGAAARGGLCRAGVVISDTPISFPHIIEADVFIAMYQSAYSKYIGLARRDGGLVVYDEGFVSPEKIDGLRFAGIPATRTAIEKFGSSTVANVILLSAAVAISGIVTRDALRKAIAEIIPPRFKELDLKAADIGFKLGRMTGPQRIPEGRVKS